MTHLQLHQAFQYILWHQVTKDAKKIAAHRKTIAADRPFWGPVLVSGFRHLANDRLRVELCSTATQDLLRATSNVLAGATELDHVTGEFFAAIALTMIDEVHRPEKQADYENLVFCAELVRNFEPQSTLTEADLSRLLDALAFTLMFHPNFFDESQRGPMMANFAEDVAQDILGAWPED